MTLHKVGELVAFPCQPAGSPDRSSGYTVGRVALVDPSQNAVFVKVEGMSDQPFDFGILDWECVSINAPTPVA